jgi:hypothetical protein
VTPHFDTFMASIDGQPAKPVGPIVVPSSGGEPIAGSNGGPPPEGGTTNHSVFVWTLHTGRNKLEVWPRNTAGRDGVKSSIELDYSNAE